MKILFVTYCRAMLGANIAMLQLMQDMRERYHVSPYVLMPEVDDGDLHLELEKIDIPYYIAPMKAWVVSAKAKYKKLRGIKAYIENCKYIRRICKNIEKERFDLIYSNNSVIQIGAYIALKLELPHIWHVREFGKIDYGIEFSYFSWQVSKRFNEAKKVIAISDAVEMHIKKNICGNANVVRIYDGVKNKKELRTVWNMGDPLQFVCVGALQEGKNQLELLKAVKILSRVPFQNKDNAFHVTFVGNGQEYETVLKNYCCENHLSSYVTFLGFRKDVNTILDNMDVGITCSKNEAFGLVTVEYLFASMPVIGANNAGTGEIITKDCGLLYESGDEKQLAEAMKTLIMDRTLIRKYGVNGYHRAYKEFTSERNTDQIMSEIYGRRI